MNFYLEKVFIFLNATSLAKLQCLRRSTMHGYRVQTPLEVHEEQGPNRYALALFNIVLMAKKRKNIKLYLIFIAINFLSFAMQLFWPSYNA